MESLLSHPFCTLPQYKMSHLWRSIARSSLQAPAPHPLPHSIHASPSSLPSQGQSEVTPRAKDRLCHPGQVPKPCRGQQQGALMRGQQSLVPLQGTPLSCPPHCLPLLQLINFTSLPLPPPPYPCPHLLPAPWLGFRGCSAPQTSASITLGVAVTDPIHPTSTAHAESNCPAGVKRTTRLWL